MSHLDSEQPLVWQSGKQGNYHTTLELWAGERVHRTLGQAWAGWLGCKLRYSEHSLILDCNLSTWQALIANAILGNLEEFLRAGIAAYNSNHDFGLSNLKFGQLLPPEYRQELEWKRAYDIERALKAMQELTYCKTNRCKDNLSPTAI